MSGNGSMMTSTMSRGGDEVAKLQAEEIAGLDPYIAEAIPFLGDIVVVATNPS
jgi:hypothetical protein